MRFLKPLLIIIFFFHFVTGYSQAKPEPKKDSNPPRLIVGVVVDQMRVEYIYRYWSRFGDGGFKKLIDKGYFFKNTHYNYVPTYTGPGHCSIYTGATPSVHGIIANEWYVKDKNVTLYCTDDSLANTIGSFSKAGLMSPRNQLSTTLGDELKLASNNKAKVFGVALKDRASILPVGHNADAAFWYDDTTGYFISSSWYLKELPAWLKQFNSKELFRSYLEKGWSTLYPIETYTASSADETNYEKGISKKTKAVFPYDLKAFVEKKEYKYLKITPWGNSITTDLAIECLKNEQMGKDDITDMLCISYSSPDIIAHAYGPRSVEVEDTYLRLDKEIEKLLNALDTEVGKDNYSLFLTADHGGGEVPNYLKDQKIPAGYAHDRDIQKELRRFCAKEFGDSLVNKVLNQQVFLNEEKFKDLKVNSNNIERTIANYLLKIDGIAEAYPSSELKYQSFSEESFAILIKRGYNFRRSGNIAFIYQPAWMDHEDKGTTHGSGYPYDTHVPLLFYGKGFKKGESVKKVYVTQIAPTISFLADINLPNGCLSKPLDDVLKSEKKEKKDKKK